MRGGPAARLLVGLLAAQLGGCALPERRYAAAELQALGAEQLRWPAARDAGQRRERERERIRREFAAGDERRLPATLAGALLFNVELPAARHAVLQALPRLAQADAAWQHAVLSAAHALQPGTDMAERLRPQLEGLAGPREFAAAGHLLLQADATATPALRVALQARPDCCEEPRLQALQARLTPAPDAAPRPELAALLAAPLRAGLPVVFSLQREGREAMGLALVRGADGRFLRQADGSLFAIAQLARARSGMPGTITNGNTPAGLYTVRGAGTALNPWIGPTPYLHSKLPVEASVAEFLHEAESAQRWSEAVYAGLLPPAWRPWLREAWLAGLAGRSEILLHGTTIPPAYYEGESYFPGTPSAGCLVAVEHWSGEDGRLLSSDRLRLLQAFAASGRSHGYLIVVDLPGQGAVGLAEVQAAVQAAERR